MTVLLDYEYKPMVGEAVKDIQSIADGAALTIRPAAGITLMIEFLGYTGAVAITLTNGTISNTIDSPSGGGVTEKASHRITHDNYILMSNSSGGALIYSYYGYIVNES